MQVTTVTYDDAKGQFKMTRKMRLHAVCNSILDSR